DLAHRHRPLAAAGHVHLREHGHSGISAPLDVLDDAVSKLRTAAARSAGDDRRGGAAGVPVLRLQRFIDIDNPDSLQPAAALDRHRRDGGGGHDQLRSAAVEPGRQHQRNGRRGEHQRLGRVPADPGLKRRQRKQHAMHLKTRLQRHARRCADERGFTMLLAVFVLTITTLLLGGAYIAVLDDSALSRNDLDQKRAYAAAQAGIQAYNFQLNQNVNYWESCLPAANSSPVTVPGSADGGATETYTIKPLIAGTAPSGTTQCDVNNPIATMIEGSSAGTAAGTFRISSTGQSAGVSRTIVAQYRSPSFLNFVYYTDYEVLDPSATPGNPTGCAVHWPSRGNGCPPIEFITGDSIKGPLHTEDWLFVCGNPVFGRTRADQIQAAGHSDEGTGCGDNSTMTGTFNSSSPSLLPPSTNAQILNVTQPAFHFTGVTRI